MERVIEKHIAKTEGVRGGKVRLMDTRITISDIVMWHFHIGQSLEEIAVKYDLSLAAVYAALSYYFDYKAEIDAEIEAGRTHYETMKRTGPSRLEEKLRTSNHG